jgi:rfaE bifunctional protein kinase chain/domain
MIAMLTETSLTRILSAIHHVRVGVVGDFNLDAYFYADMTRASISRETPLFNRPVTRETYSLGGAANVAWNLAALGAAEVHAFTVVGQDWRAGLLGALMAEQGIQQAGVIAEAGFNTMLFGKVILTNGSLSQEDARLDFTNLAPPALPTIQTLIESLTEHLPHLDALVVADYLPGGVITPALHKALIAWASQYHNVVFVADSRERIHRFPGMVLKPNLLEAVQVALPGHTPGPITPAEVRQAGRALQISAGKPVYLTQAEQGCLLFESAGQTHIPALSQPGPVDPVGAGDTFTAAVAASLAAGASPVEAGQVASLAAGVTVRKLHITGTATPAELLQVFGQLPTGL